MRLKCLVLSLMVVLACLFTGCGEKPYRETGIYFDTLVQLTVYGKEVPPEAIKLCEKYDKLFSATNPDSEIYKLNESGSMEVSDETLTVIKTALEFSRQSEDLFCISILPLTKLWDFGAENPELPNPEELNAALEKIGSDKIKIRGNRVTLEKGSGIDLGAIAKGYISDKIAELYKADNLSGIIDLGGNILTVGEKADGKPYRIGVKKPFTENENLCTLEITEAAVSTCGVYERYFKLNGKLYHHIINPNSGYPQDSELLSVTVISESSTTADSLSTMLFMLGEKEAKAYLKSRPDTQAVFVREDGTVSFSEGFQSSPLVKADITQ